MATSTNDINALTSFNGTDDPAITKLTEVSTKIATKTSPHERETEYRSLKKPVEKVALAELLVNHDHEQQESLSEIQQNNINLVRPGNRAQLAQGSATTDTGYVNARETNWISRFRFATILLCFTGLFLFSYRLQNYSNELRFAILSLEKRIGTNNSPSPNGVPVQNVLTEINEKYLSLEKKVSKIAKEGNSGQIPMSPSRGGIEKKNDPLYQSLEKRLAALEHQLLEQSPRHTARISQPVSLKKKALKSGIKQIDESLTTEPIVGRQGWVVNLLSFKTMRSAEKFRNKFAEKGIYTHPHPVDIKGSRWYRLRAVGFPTRQKAIEFGDVAKSTLGLDAYWLAFE